MFLLLKLKGGKKLQRLDLFHPNNPSKGEISKPFHRYENLNKEHSVSFTPKEDAAKRETRPLKIKAASVSRA